MTATADLNPRALARYPLTSFKVNVLRAVYNSSTRKVPRGFQRSHAVRALRELVEIGAVRGPGITDTYNVTRAGRRLLDEVTFS